MEFLFLLCSHIYLGYECHEDADADFHRLDGWRLEGSDNILVKFVVDTGWGSGELVAI